MPCASVSEKPTRVNDENLNGGLRSVTRPRLGTIGPNAKRLLVARESTRPWGQAFPGAGEAPVADHCPHTPAGEAQQQEPDDRERNDRVYGTDLTRAGPPRARGSVVGRATRRSGEVGGGLDDRRLAGGCKRRPRH